MTAVWQHVSYREFLPSVLGPVVMQQYGLTVGTSGHWNGEYIYNLDAFTQCCCNVGPPSKTLKQHWVIALCLLDKARHCSAKPKGSTCFFLIVNSFCLLNLPGSTVASQFVITFQFVRNCYKLERICNQVRYHGNKYYRIYIFTGYRSSYANV